VRVVNRFSLGGARDFEILIEAFVILCGLGSYLTLGVKSEV